MPLRRVSAIVLRTYRVGEADKIVVFFSREMGKLRGIAKGARRARSRFGGSLEIGNEVELTFFEKEGRDLPSVDRCDIVRSRFSRLGDPILATTLGYITDLADAFLPERETNQRAYRLLRAAIGSLSSAEVAETRARYFEAWLLRLSGLYPLRHTCPSCGKPLHSEGAWFSFDERHLTCRNCREREPSARAEGQTRSEKRWGWGPSALKEGPQPERSARSAESRSEKRWGWGPSALKEGGPRGFPLSPKALGFLDDVWRLPPDELEPPEANVLAELREFHYRLMQEHLEKDLKSLHVLEEVLRESAGAKPKP
jgi:DNA repair protein RecO (recombination protein O)